MGTGGPSHLFRRRRLPRVLTLVGVVAVAVVAATGVWFMFRSLGSGTKSAASASPSTSPSPIGRPKIKGVVVQVLNGTTRRNLAAMTSGKLEKAGYDVKEPANSKTRRTVTLVKYRPKFVADAAFLKRVYLPRAVLQRSRARLPGGVDIEVILGTDAPG
jgi:LytR cell envelope-related transcriptional attenuator